MILKAFEDKLFGLHSEIKIQHYRKNYFNFVKLWMFLENQMQSLK